MSKALIACYCNYKWEYSSVDELMEKFEEDDSTIHTWVIFYTDKIRFQRLDFSDEVKYVTYNEFIELATKNHFTELYDWEAPDV
tara:strand:+ start:245 stop:496 length:252 start_codon:yes stop_codon:yes gene_type:complete